ncbi:polymer-forming cytoskeletal protein [Phaeovibrio sulfidiphilus]|uniref:Polymer-forming cytoskeletal protein n=1 Tax=Phaeovibrio sulfidiphilus TaxID=1220600 RepID=A0A8J6YQK1_9PROT|nr:polymer-forming cytoskeletal protein [Phaeovibrio sulfidiphilus]
MHKSSTDGADALLDDDIPPLPSDDDPVLSSDDLEPTAFKPAATRGTPMASRPNVASLKTPDFSRRMMDLPGALRPHEAGSVSEKTLTVGRDISLSGEISKCDHLVVEGRIQANLEDATSLSVYEGGEFKGRVDVKEAHIHGHFEGDLVAHQRAVIYSTARFEGTLKTAAITVEEGAVIKGTLDPMESPRPSSSVLP